MRANTPLRAAAVAFLSLMAGTPAAQAAGRAALVIDGNTGQDLHAREADRPLYPASLTKMMTLYIVFDLIEQKRISNATSIHVTARCAAQPPSSLDLEAGSALPLREAVLALIVKSANDVACAIGENLAGSEDKFAQLMTARARQLGMRATTFRNASGLPDPSQVTTARDMVTLAMRLAHDFPEHYKLFATREFSHNGKSHRSHNSLLHGFEGTDGIKTGYTRASGFNLVSSVRRGQKHVIGVVMGGVTAAQRNSTMRALLTQGLGRARAMAKPMLVSRPALVSPALVSPALVAPALVAQGPTPDKPPVPRRVAPATDRATPAASIAPAAALVRSTASGQAPGRPPATLQDQVAKGAVPQVGDNVATARASVQPAGLGARAIPAPPVAAQAHAASAGSFQVQIGAFSTVAEAQKQLQAVSERAGTVLSGHPPLTIPVAMSNVQFIRARFAGFHEAKAKAACVTLRQQKIECVVMRAE